MSQDALVLRRSYDATPERVYEAWTHAKDLQRWYTPDIESPIDLRKLDVRVGGGWVVAFGAAEGATPYVETGTYLELDPPHRLVVDTVLEHGDEVLSRTHCVIEIAEQGGRTEVTMTETGFPAEVKEDRHEGWARTLDNLNVVLA